MSPMSSLTIRISDGLRHQLEELSRQNRQSISHIARESLRRYVTTEQLRQIRKTTRLRAGARGFLTDNDVFKAVS
jgi:predicted transcriptional regulator